MTPVDDDFDDGEEEENKGKPPEAKRNHNGQPHGPAMRSLRRIDYNIRLLDDEIWQWKTRPGASYLHMNGVAVEALKALYQMDRKFLESGEARAAKERVLARGPRKRQVGTKFMKEEIDFWKILAGRHEMPPNALLMWAFALCDMVERGSRG